MGGYHGLCLRHAAQQNNKAQTADQASHASLSFTLFFANTLKRKKVFQQNALAALQKT